MTTPYIQPPWVTPLFGKMTAGTGAIAPMMQMARDYKFDLLIGGGDVPSLAGGSRDAAAPIRAFLAESTQFGNEVASSGLY